VQILTFRAGSAGGPKPGRAGFYLELARPLFSEFRQPILYGTREAGYNGVECRDITHGHKAYQFRFNKVLHGTDLFRLCTDVDFGQSCLQRANEKLRQLNLNDAAGAKVSAESPTTNTASGHIRRR